MKKSFEKILAILDFLIPKDKDLVVFGGNEMRGINGNVAEIIKSWPKKTKGKGLRAYVLSVSGEEFPGVETIDPRNLKGIFTILRAGTAVVSHVYGDLYWHSLYNGNRRRIINLWHGTPLKRIGPWRGWGKTTAMIAASKIERLTLAGCLEQVRLEQIFVTGFPRSDKLFNDLQSLRQETLRKLGLRDDGQKWLLYAPTYRKSSRLPHYIHRMPGFSYKSLYRFLEQQNAKLLVRPHVNYVFTDFPENDRIIFVPFTKIAEIEPLFALADLLITDYSSSIFEYLNLNRPIVAFVPDLEEYEKIPGLLFDYETIFPGLITKTWKDLQKSIVESLYSPSKYTSLREDRKKMFNEFTDGKSTERCIEIICDMSLK
ncbi:MAG: CDP-glycerol glycerophosphotransferase family protein [Candidatus Woykebacteria bacterium]